jgi:hypothetical protein
MIEIILFLVVIIIICACQYNHKKSNKSEPFKKSNDKCNLDIDNLYIYDRDKNYNKYIGKVIDENNNINYSKEEIEIMKNKHQFYNLDDKKNISNLVMGKCKNSYGDGSYDIGGGSYDIGSGSTDIDVSSYDLGGGSYYGYNSNVSGGFNSDIDEVMGYGDVKGSLIENENKNEKGICDYNLNNYYYDLKGNNIKSTLQEYRKNINNSDECIPITYTNEPKKNSDMIIPNTYDINKDLTNAYDVNWSKVLNPLTIY